MKIDRIKVFRITSIFKVIYFQFSGKYKGKGQSLTGHEFVMKETGPCLPIDSVHLPVLQPTLSQVNVFMGDDTLWNQNLEFEVHISDMSR